VCFVVSNRNEKLQSNGSQCLHLLRSLLKYLGILATFIPSERLFFKAGNIVSSSRGTVILSNVCVLVFLSDCNQY